MDLGWHALLGAALGAHIVGWLITWMWWVDYREVDWYGPSVIVISAILAVLLLTFN